MDAHRHTDKPYESSPTGNRKLEGTGVNSPRTNNCSFSPLEYPSMEVFGEENTNQAESQEWLSSQTRDEK